MRSQCSLCLLLVGVLTSAAPAQQISPPGRLPLLEPEAAWKLLPRQQPPLPGWALMLLPSLPRTTGAMLDLDYLHRANNPLGSVLSGKLRWIAADVIGCDYARRYAEFDLRQAGLRDDDLKKLNGAELPVPERAALKFARKMTRAAHSVTDAEVAELIELYGPEKVVAMVHTLAHANFQIRLFLALGVVVEQGGPYPAVDLKLDPRQRVKVPTPARPAWESLANAKVSTEALPQPDWRKVSFDEIEQALEQQKSRKPRIKLLDRQQLAHLPPDEKEPALRIIWSNVGMGYQPTLTRAWFTCMGHFQQEAQLPRLFRSSLFWVITRSNECFY